MAKMKNFLEAYDKCNGKFLFEDGKEGDKIDQKVRDALTAAKISYLWSFQPDGYDIVILEHDKNGEKAGSWSIAFLTEAQLGANKKDVEDVFGEGLNEAEVGFKVLEDSKGNFLDIVNLAIEIAGNEKYKKGFTAQTLKSLKVKK